MLMKVVLPAPLAPMSPTIESFSTSAFTSLAAVTAPKLLLIPRAWRMAAISRGLAPGKERPEPVGQEHDQREQRRAEAHLPGVGRQIVGHGVDDAEDQRAGKRRDHVPRPGKDGDEDEFARSRPVRHFRVDMAD